MRDRPESRLEMFTAFENALKKYNKNYILLKGDKETRLDTASKAIDKIIASKNNLYSFSDSIIDSEINLSEKNLENSVKH